MPAISLKGVTSSLKSRRSGGDLVVEKTIQNAILTEVHKPPGKRVTGKQADTSVITLTPAEVNALDRDTQRKVQIALDTGRDESKKRLAAMTAVANKSGAKVKAKHTAVAKKQTLKVTLLTKQLKESIEEKKRHRLNSSESKKKRKTRKR